MAVTLEDLAARMEKLEREKALAEQKVAALEEEIRALRAAPETPERAHHSAVRRTLRRPMTRLGLLAAAGAAGASAVLPAGARAATHPASISPHAQIISPNGQYVLDVVNSGIYLKGPTGGIELTGGQIRIACAGTTTVNGTVLKLNSGGSPVARLGDSVLVNTPAGTGTGTITSGATTVLA